jgi:hypothetical protein
VPDDILAGGAPPLPDSPQPRGKPDDATANVTSPSISGEERRVMGRV